MGNPGPYGIALSVTYRSTIPPSLNRKTRPCRILHPKAPRVGSAQGAGADAPLTGAYRPRTPVCLSVLRVFRDAGADAPLTGDCRLPCLKVKDEITVKEEKMQNDLKDKVVVLTGAGGGIGQAIAVKLAELGMKIVLFGGNNPEKLEITRQSVEKFSTALVLPGNLTDLEFLASGIKSVVEKFGGIDTLINNAGVAQSTPYIDVTPEEFDRIMAINTRVPFFLTQKALPFLKNSSSATVINIASVVAHAGYPLQSVYTASKHALLGLTKSLAKEYYQENIRVHAICPGGVYTDMIRISRPDLTSEGMIMPDEVAEIVAFFLQHRGNAVIDEIILHRVNKEPFLA